MIKSKIIFRLFKIINVKKSYLFFIFFLFIASSMIDLLSIGLIAPYVSTILDVENNFYNFSQSKYFQVFEKKKLIITLSIFLIIIFLLKTILSIFIRWMITKFAYTQYTNIQLSLMNAYQNMKFEDHISRNSSEYKRNIRELSSDCASAIDAYFRAISEFLIFITIFLFLVFVNFKIVIFILIFFLPVFFIYDFFLKPINSKLGKMKIELSKQVFKLVDSGINAFKEIKVFKKQNFFLSTMKYKAKKIIDVELKSSLIKDSPRYVFEFTVIAPLLLFIIFLFIDSSFNVTDYIPIITVFIFAALRILPSVASIVNSQGRFNYAVPAVKVVVDDLEKNNLESHKLINLNNKSNIELDTFSKLSLQNISFKYRNSNRNIFNNLNLEINKYDCIGITGESGVGKTTLIHILLGLIKPQNGIIKLNGREIDNIEIIKNFSAYLPQDPIILDESLEKNISLEQEENKINYQKFEESIKKANLKDVIDNLPKGKKTLIGENGVRLSGGQYRRTAIARTFYHGKEIIIMDEATSSLDAESENFIAEQINDLKGKITIIIISHHKNILKYCDKIYNIKNQNIFLI